MTPFEVTVLSVTSNAAGIVPSANNRFPLPNVIGNIFAITTNGQTENGQIVQETFLTAPNSAATSSFLPVQKDSLISRD